MFRRVGRKGGVVEAAVDTFVEAETKEDADIGSDAEKDFEGGTPAE
jgi:hypothetical protein